MEQRKRWTYTTTITSEGYEGSDAYTALIEMIAAVNKNPDGPRIQLPEDTPTVEYLEEAE
jgi:hypothetical protein